MFKQLGILYTHPELRITEPIINCNIQRKERTGNVYSFVVQQTSGVTGRLDTESWGPSGAVGPSGTGIRLAPGLRGSVTGFFAGLRGDVPAGSLPLIPEFA